jgi:hypothetical protein
MAWELQVLAADGSGSLGTVDEVQGKLRAAVPGIVLGRDASGSEKIAAMEAAGVEVPDVIREQWLGSKGAFLGRFESGDIAIEFSLGEDEAKVTAVLIDVRGSGDPMPIVRRLMAIEGWDILDASGRAPTKESWESFGAWRDDAVGRLSDGET